MAESPKRQEERGDVALRFGVNLRRLRAKARRSQEEVAFRAGLHRTEIGLLERGARVPGIDTVARVAGALSISPGELFEGIEWEAGEVGWEASRAAKGKFKILPQVER
jgi:transcriptional regulator with XRE-family HTH domain